PADMPDRGPDTGLPGERGGARDGARRSAGRSQSQHRNRPTSVPHGPIRWTLLTHTRALVALATLRSRDSDQNRSDGGPRRESGRGPCDAPRLAKGWLPDPHDRTVSATDDRPRSGRPLLPSG